MLAIVSIIEGISGCEPSPPERQAEEGPPFTCPVAQASERAWRGETEVAICSQANKFLSVQDIKQ